MPARAARLDALLNGARRTALGAGRRADASVNGPAHLHPSAVRVGLDGSVLMAAPQGHADLGRRGPVVAAESDQHVTDALMGRWLAPADELFRVLHDDGLLRHVSRVPTPNRCLLAHPVQEFGSAAHRWTLCIIVTRSRRFNG